MPQTIFDPAKLEEASEKELAKVKAEKPNSFTVGAHADILARKGEATISYDRRWYNGWGATAYIKGWYNDTAVVPQAKRGVTIGGEGSYKF
jgi:hypothetical protein